MNYSCLIITSESDIHADAVIDNIYHYGINAIRLNIDTFIQKSSYAYEWNFSVKLIEDFLFFNDSKKRAENIKVIWWRKLGSWDRYTVFPEIMEESAINYCQKETDALIHSLPGLYPQAKWINSWHNIEYSSYRINQIAIAKKLNLKIPETIVTNSYEKLEKFIHLQGDCIIKPITQHPAFTHNGNQHRLYTRKIDHVTLQEFKNIIHFSPVFLQKEIKKKHEYRVTIIDDNCFVCRIESQDTDDENVKIDWRIVDPNKLGHYADNLPSEYLLKLQKMLSEFHLNFGAFDIIEDINYDLFFIELNPNGQWYWIELLTGMPIAQAMANLIKKLAYRD